MANVINGKGQRRNFSHIKRGPAKEVTGSPSFRSMGERNFWRYLNHIGIKSRYESVTFRFPVKRGVVGYCPDFYIPALDIYIEYKGYFSKEDATRFKRLKIHQPEVYSRVYAVVANPTCQAAKAFAEIKIPIYAYMKDIEKQYGSVIAHWDE